MKPVLRSVLIGLWVGSGTAGAAPWDFDNGPPHGLPELSRYEAPAFPPQLRATTVTAGYATIIFTVKPDGRIEDAMALEASDPAFVETTLEALERWRLASARGNTTPRREVIQFDYRRTGTIASLSQNDASKAAFTTAPAPAPSIRTLTWQELDHTPRRLAGAMPEYPASLRAARTSGHATLDFVVDSDGKVRVPTVVESSAEEFGAAALDAVKRWRFEPPRSDGVAVNVHVLRSFSFGGAGARPSAESRPIETDRIAQNP